jgi:hypothetical protein
MIPIKDYSEIRILPNSLIVLDIDDTIIKFPELGKEWWKNSFDNYMKIYNDKDKADNQTLEDWINHVKVMKPKMINKESFECFIKNVLDNNCELVLVTARQIRIKELTEAHLTHCEFIIDTSNIYYSQNKGDEINKILQTRFTNIKNIIFVDDMVKNLMDAYKKIDQSKYNLYLYNFIH